MILSRRHLLALLISSALPCAGAAMDRRSGALPDPEGEVILTVQGRIGRTNHGSSARLDMKLLESFGVAQLRTATPWSEGEVDFTGVPGERLMEALAADGERLRVRALNDYQVKIPVSDLRSYQVLFALRQAGRPLSVRERGPIWIIYPWSQHPELDTRTHRQRSVWQLTEIIVE